MPRRICWAANGFRTLPTSMTTSMRSAMAKAMRPKALAKEKAMGPSLVRVKCGKRSLAWAQSKRPESTITPPIVVP